MAQQPQTDVVDTKFTIIINQKQSSYDEATLQQFEFFRAYFSKRWQSGNDENETKSTIIDVGKHVFSLEHLNYLANISTEKSIPADLGSNDFRKLIECDLYLGSDCLTMDILINFLELRLLA